MTILLNKFEKKQMTYILLSLTSLFLSSASYSVGDLEVKEDLNRCTKGIKVPFPVEKNISDELENKPVYLYDILGIKTENDKDRDLKKKPQDEDSLKKEAKSQAKTAARKAAKKAAFGLLKDKEKAKLVVRSIMKREKLEKSHDEKENRVLKLAQNHAMNAAREAAFGVAYNLLQNEEKAGKVVASLKLDHYGAHKNPKGKSMVVHPSDESNVVSLQDLRTDRAKLPRREKVSSAQVSSAISTATKGAGILFKGFELLHKFKVL